MQAVVNIADARARKEEERKQRRAAAARRRYYEDPDAARERRRTDLRVQRAGGGSVRVRYDVEDYADEWMFLTRMGVKAEDIISRSCPSREWFVRNLLPVVTRARCAKCDEVFNPQVSGMLTRCSASCNVQPHPAGHHPWWD